MKRIINYFNFLSKIVNKDNKKVLGRWNTDYCSNKINIKVDLSNEDHCGICSEYILIKKNINNNLKNNGVKNSNNKYK